jgi:HupE / UreJ protein
MDRVSPTPRLRIRRIIAALFGVLSYAAALSTPVCAHDIPDEIMLRSFVKPDGDWLHVLVRIPLPVLLTPDLPRSELGRMDDKLEEASAAFARQVVFYEDDRPLVRETPSRARISLPSDPSFESFESAFDNIRGPALPTGTQVARTDGYFDAYLRYPISSENSAFAMDIGLDGGWSGRLKMFVRFITPDGTIRAYELHGGSGLFLLDPGWYRAAWTFGELGFEHILGGIDHLLFLLCLVIPFGLAHFRALVAVISTFTVAHSITLIASASGLAPAAEWFPPLVEALIALSILYMALENIILALREGRNVDAGMLRRCLVVGAFGLVHGFGFSFILSQQLQFAGNHLLLSLLSFNLGVEIGQIAFLAVALPLLSVGLREKDGRRIGIVIVSTLVAHVAWHWLSERWETLASWGWHAAGVARVETNKRSAFRRVSRHLVSASAPCVPRVALVPFYISVRGTIFPISIAVMGVRVSANSFAFARVAPQDAAQSAG